MPDSLMERLIPRLADVPGAAAIVLGGSRARGTSISDSDYGEKAIARGEQTHVAGCVCRALCCIGQVLFALNRRYLINEKGALDEASHFPCTIADLPGRVAGVWQAIGRREFDAAFGELGAFDRELRGAA